MTSPVFLIAEREFRTYVATLSFWVALAVGPLAAGGGLMLAQSAQHPVGPAIVQIVGQDRSLTDAAKAALTEALDRSHADKLSSLVGLDAAAVTAEPWPA